MTTETKAHITTLRPFIPMGQLANVVNLMRGEDGEFFVAKLAELAGIVREMPRTYAQEGLGDDAIIWLHYFCGGSDWWITEKDIHPNQLQAFGLVHMRGNYPELGYIPISEMLPLPVELDFHWRKKTIREVKEKIGYRP